MKRLLSVLLLAVLWSCSTPQDSELSPGASYHYFSTDHAANGTPAVLVGEQYNTIVENPFIDADKEPTSTFSIDADGGPYANVRRFLTQNMKPPVDAIRTEELINYFVYKYDDPTDQHPVAVNGEVSGCPWQPAHKLIRIGLKGKTIAQVALPPSNIVLLVDVSGSMGDPDKLALLKESLPYLVDQLRPQDKMAIVTYAGQAGVALEATSGDKKNVIKAAISQLGAGGSTAGAAGIITAYEIAEKNFVKDGNNRVILATDGDFNVGPSSQQELVDLIVSKRDKGVFLSVIGLGTGNLNDGMMEQVANKGNGIYEYIDNLDQAKKVFVHEFSKFYTVAKDVKVQVAFNPELVKSYRLIGYENRLLNKEDFTDDKKDAGEISAAQTITALYEIVPSPVGARVAFDAGPAFTIDFRYKQPTADNSQAISLQVFDRNTPFAEASESMRFAASVAGFGLVMRNSAYKGTLTFNDVRSWATGAAAYDPNGYRKEFIQLVDKARQLQ